MKYLTQSDNTRWTIPRTIKNLRCKEVPKQRLNNVPFREHRLNNVLEHWAKCQVY